MRTFLAAALVAMLAMSLGLGPAAAVEAERTIELNDTDNTSANWTSETFVGAAPQFFLDTAPANYECADRTQCEYSLIAIEGLTQEEIDAHLEDGGILQGLRDNVTVTLGITNYSVPVSDLDIIVWQSNADGDKIAELDRVGDLDTDPSEESTVSVSVRGDRPVAYLLLEVVFFAGAGTYDGYVSVF